MAVGLRPKDRERWILTCYYGGPVSCPLFPSRLRSSKLALVTDVGDVLCRESGSSNSRVSAIYNSLAFVFGAQLAKRQAVGPYYDKPSKPCRTRYVKEQRGLNLTARGLHLTLFFSSPCYTHGAKVCFFNCGVFKLSLRGRSDLNTATELSSARRIDHVALVIY